MTNIRINKKPVLYTAHSAHKMAILNAYTICEYSFLFKSLQFRVCFFVDPCDCKHCMYEPCDAVSFCLVWFPCGFRFFLRLVHPSLIPSETTTATCTHTHTQETVTPCTLPRIDITREYCKSLQRTTEQYTSLVYIYNMYEIYHSFILQIRSLH